MDILAVIIAFLTSIFGTSSVNYSYVVYEIVSNDVVLISNYQEKKSSVQLIDENGCVAGINGGFYGEDGKPQGLVVIKGSQTANKKASLLFNGYVYTDRVQIKVARDMIDNPEYAVQTGPLLFENGRRIDLKIKNDKPARRMVVAETKTGKAYFLSFYNPESKLDGPKLADLPGELARVAEEKGLKVESAINLDGGSASAFYSPEITLSELLPVGSWWCVK